MLCGDILMKIASKLDFHTIPAFSCCNKKIRMLIWCNPLFWGLKLKMDFNFQPKKVDMAKEFYKFMSIYSPQQSINKASSLGYLELVMYYVENFPDLNLKVCMKEAIINRRKNILNYFKRMNIEPLTHFEIYAAD